jgi:hypothetical protein
VFMTESHSDQCSVDLIALSHGIESGVREASSKGPTAKGQLPGGGFFFSRNQSLGTNLIEPFRIFLVGSRTECSLPFSVWEQLSFCFPGVPFHIVFIGPEVNVPNSLVMDRYSDAAQEETIQGYNSDTGAEESATVYSYPVSMTLKLSYINSAYSDSVHRSFGPFQSRRDTFFLFNSGIGHQSGSKVWDKSLSLLFKSKCLVTFTSYNKDDLEFDVGEIERRWKGEFSVVLKPVRNRFSSLRSDIAADSVGGDTDRMDMGEEASNEPRLESKEEASFAKADLTSTLLPVLHTTKSSVVPFLDKLKEGPPPPIDMGAPFVWSNWGVFCVRGIGTDVGTPTESLVADTSPKSWRETLSGLLQ